MKVRSARIESSPKLMIIPMIDIIFFLLVFFMMSTLNMVHQKALSVDLPKAMTANQMENKTTSITLLADGMIQIDETIVSKAEMKNSVMQKLQENNEMAVVLRADKLTEHGKVIEVMDTLKEVGVKKLAIAAEKKGT